MRTLIALLMIALSFGTARAQDLEPRAFSPAPVGLNIALLGYTNSQGNVFFDRALLIEDATGEVHSATGAYVRTFGISGMSAKFSTVIPFAWGDWKGVVDGVPASTSRRGLADPRFQLAVNFVGAPAVSLKDFAAYSEGTIVGASLLMIVPIGQYDPTKLINLGSGRWSFRPRVGLSNRLGRWTVETMVDAWFFTTIPEAYGGTVIAQDPIWTIQADLIYRFKKGFWIGVIGGLADGGRTTVNGVKKANAQRSTRLGMTLAVPLTARHSVRFFYANSVSTRLGADFNLLNISLQYRWGGGL